MGELVTGYIDNNGDGCPDNPPAFLRAINSGGTNNQGAEGRGALILTKKMGFQMPPGTRDLTNDNVVLSFYKAPLPFLHLFMIFLFFNL